MNNKIEILVRNYNDEKWRKETISYISDKFDGSLLAVIVAMILAMEMVVEAEVSVEMVVAFAMMFVIQSER